MAAVSFQFCLSGGYNAPCGHPPRIGNSHVVGSNSLSLVVLVATSVHILKCPNFWTYQSDGSLRFPNAKPTAASPRVLQAGGAPAVIATPIATEAINDRLSTIPRTRGRSVSVTPCLRPHHGNPCGSGARVEAGDPIAARSDAEKSPSTARLTDANARPRSSVAL